VGAAIVMVAKPSGLDELQAEQAYFRLAVMCRGCVQQSLGQAIARERRDG
jgi:hypothetical protein